MTSELEIHLLAQLHDHQRHFWHRLRWYAVRSHITTKETIEIVDVGAGAGLLGLFLRRDRPQATYRFIEPIESLRRALRATYGESSDASGESSFASANFVTLLDVLEHQEDDRAFIQDLVAKMPKGSLLLLTVPALPSLWSKWDVALGHFRRYSKSTLAEVIAGLPLDVVELNYLFPEMVPLGYVRARRSRSGDKSAGGGTELPTLPRLLNALIFRFGLISLRLRRVAPVGTSLFLVARVVKN
jgi:hypothetical protein